MIFASGLLLILLGFTMKFFPPKNINKFYGYRTELAKSSQRAWDLAQEHSRKMNIIYGIRMLVVGTITGIFLFLQKVIFVVLGIELFILMPIFTFARNGATERHLAAKLNKRSR